MSTAKDTQATREEEIAFLTIERALGIEVQLADAGAGDKMPDGKWRFGPSGALQAIVEITSPPAHRAIGGLARATRARERYIESGSMPVRRNELAEVCQEWLSEDWAIDNINKLNARPADERHLFLFARTYDREDYLLRLGDAGDGPDTEFVADLELPDGISDVWFRGRACRGESGQTAVRVSRFQRDSGWKRYTVTLNEAELPAPNAQLVGPDRWAGATRQPKERPH